MYRDANDLTLYDHQVSGAPWLAARPRAALLDEQGLGKTITVIEAANLLRRGTQIPGGWRTLIIAPTCVLWNWEREWRTWTCSSYDRVQVVERLATKIDLNAEVVLITHRALIEESILRQVVSRTWNLVVLDESHFFRTPTAKRTQFFYGKTKPENSIVGRSKRTWVLSGTPMPNDVRNLWTMAHGLRPDLFPFHYQGFSDRYAIVAPSMYGDGTVLENRNVPELKAKLREFCLRRTVDQCLTLPKLRFEEITLRPERMPPEIELIEKEIGPTLREHLAETDDPERAFRILGKKLELSTWRRLCGLAKVDPVVELLALEKLPKVVLFTHHLEVAAELCERIGPQRCVVITGQTSPRKRQEAVDHFQLNPGIEVAICQVVAGGTGITLTESTEALFVEMSFVPGENDQAARRVYRIGQDRPCRVRYVSLAGTSDELVVEILARKARQIREVIA